ncbi:GNAT family N-acetyltransferase [Mycobacterium sp. OAE908]|uniref:GNAT family N-acetyltransferase n=1 Tax=Mycobacterium sp. OAE908 TaxID=2817899 RepID=UPI001AEAE14B
MRLRLTNFDDTAFIVEMARHACVIEDWPLPEADSEDTRSLLPGIDDTGIVASGAGEVRLGAVWTFRHNPPLLFDAENAPLPEIAIAVVREMRGQGIGAALLDELIEHCTGKYDALALVPTQRVSCGGSGSWRSWYSNAQGIADGLACGSDIFWLWVVGCPQVRIHPQVAVECRGFGTGVR